MALIKFGGGIVQASGSIAGTTHARNRFGNYIRARTKPVNPRSTSQTLVRNAMAYLADRWHSALTSAERAAWDLYAANVPMKNRLGDTINLTGFNHFIRSNSTRIRCGAAVVDAGPTVFSLPEKDPTIVDTITFSGQEHSLAFDIEPDWLDEDTGFLTLSMGIPQLATRNFFNGPWRWNFKIDGDSVTPPTSPQTNAVIFTVATDQKVWITCRIGRADGRLSEPFRAETIVTAGT